jgi:hypothetical protein
MDFSRSGGYAEPEIEHQWQIKIGLAAVGLKHGPILFH